MKKETWADQLSRYKTSVAFVSRMAMLGQGSWDPRKQLLSYMAPLF